MSVQAPVSEADSNAPVTVVWGTMVSLNASMDAFRSFLKDFKAKYRQQYDSEQPLDASHAHVYDDPETRVFESYMRKMRETSQTNLNLDMLDLASFPLTSKLFHQLQSYPQEIIPILDQVLKDEVLALADADLEDDGQFLEGQELRQRKDQISQISQSMFKVRPFGGDRTVNLRDLNPGGTHAARTFPRFPSLTQSHRHRQARLCQGIGHSRNASHPRHETWYATRPSSARVVADPRDVSLLPLLDLPPHRHCRN